MKDKPKPNKHRITFTSKSGDSVVIDPKTGKIDESKTQTTLPADHTEAKK